MNEIIQGDSLSVLRTLPSESVNCVVTSPPYWGLRDYGIEGQLGLEKTFEEYITKLCDIFDEIKRVLRKDGTCWVNLGDSYNSHSTGNGNVGGIEGKNKPLCDIQAGNNKKPNLPDKSLCLIPQRFAIEMVNRGWICRNTIIWHKPNCMPSSAKDRFTVDFEYVFFFVKSQKYWFEQVFEPHLENKVGVKKETELLIRKNFQERPSYNDFNKWYQQNINNKSKFIINGQSRNGLGEGNSLAIYYKVFGYNLGRNKRCVWTVTTQPFKEAHFATYPEKLISPMIQAGCPKYICKKCGKAREKIYKEGDLVTSGPNKMAIKPRGFAQNKMVIQDLPKDPYGDMPRREKDFIGYSSCSCNAGFEPGVVLDPFSGAGTTAVVAKKQGKRYLGIEIKREYIDMSDKRLKKIPELLF
jgi:DNA modification methylase